MGGTESGVSLAKKREFATKGGEEVATTVLIITSPTQSSLSGPNEKREKTERLGKKFVEEKKRPRF